MTIGKRMRILFSVYPFAGHLFPLVSTAWALRAAGHDVLLAGFQGPFDVIAKTGLPFVEVVEFAEMESIHRKFFGSPQERAEEGGTEADADPNPITGLLSAWSSAMVDGTVSVARRWKPDLVIHDVVQAAGPLAAAVVGVPSVEHRCGFLPDAAGLVPIMRARLASDYERHGVAGKSASVTAIDLAPPSMTGDVSADAWPVRYVPYGSGGPVPDWAIGASDRPRVAVTLGTTTPDVLGVGHFKSIVEAAAATDAEFVLALGSADPAPLGTLPDNVRLCGWIPLHVLLDTCSAIIHQGGIGTTLSALHTGIPQLVLPTGHDYFVNANALEKRGVGLSAEPDQVDAELLGRLLGDRALSTAAVEVRDEMTGTEAPGDAVARLVELAG